MLSMPFSYPCCLYPVHVHVVYDLFVSLLYMPCSYPCCLYPVRVHCVYALFTSMVSMPCSLPFCLGPIHFHFMYALFTSIVSMSCPCACCLCPENDLHLLEWGWWRDFSPDSKVPSPWALWYGALLHHSNSETSMVQGQCLNFITCREALVWVQAMIQHRTYRLAKIRPELVRPWFSTEHTD